MRSTVRTFCIRRLIAYRSSKMHVTNSKHSKAYLHAWTLDLLCAACVCYMVPSSIGKYLVALFAERKNAVIFWKPYSFSYFSSGNHLCCKCSNSARFLRQICIISSHAGGHWFESSSLHHKNTGNCEISGVFICFLELFDAIKTR